MIERPTCQTCGQDVPVVLTAGTLLYHRRLKCVGTILRTAAPHWLTPTPGPGYHVLVISGPTIGKYQDWRDADIDEVHGIITITSRRPL